jgi:hypothetical protein
MSQALAPTDTTPRRAGAPLAPNLVCSWNEEGVNAARMHHTAQRGIAGASQVELALDEQMRACSVVLNMLELALIDRSDVDAVLKSSIRARRAVRQTALVRAQSDLAAVFMEAGLSG